jgi:nickel/cobalt transporter (NicO) family protein
MNSILLSTITVSILHAMIPSHWLPLLTIAKTNKWTKQETLWVTFYMGAAHVLSTILLGAVLAFIGIKINHLHAETFELIAPIALIIMGLFFIYRHYTHHHFHIDANANVVSKSKIIVSLVSLMFISPCLEVETFFFAAAPYGINYVLLLALLYGVISIIGMLLWMYIALTGLKKLNWHKIEHNAGLFTGFVLILCGILTFFIH